MIATIKGIDREVVGIFSGFSLYYVFCLKISGSLCIVNVDFIWAGLVLREVNGHR